MSARSLILLLVALLTATPGVAEPARLEFLQPAKSWAEALPIGGDRAAALVKDSVERTELRWFAPAKAWLENARGHLEKSGRLPEEAIPEGAGLLQIDWLGEGEAADFRRRLDQGNGRFVSQLRVGRTTLTRTIFASRDGSTIFIHVLADMPGALGLRVSLKPTAEGPVTVEDRRQLVWKEAGEGAEGEVRVWVLPFESDVERDGDRILLRGEGEALIILAFGKGSQADVLRALGEQYDPGHQRPNPILIWRGVSAAQAQVPQ